MFRLISYFHISCLIMPHHFSIHFGWKFGLEGGEMPEFFYFQIEAYVT